MTAVKSVRLPEEILRGVRERARREGVEESTAIRQLLRLGAQDYAVSLYRRGKVTLREAAQVANLSVREMLQVLWEHGVGGNVTLDQQAQAIEWVRKA